MKTHMHRTSTPDARRGACNGGHKGRRCIPHASGREAFTLVELLVAITILLIFDMATGIFEQIEDDLEAAKSQFWGTEADAFDTRVKFWVDQDQQVYTDAGGASRTNRRPRLRFVRGIPDDSVNPRIRAAGNGVDDDPPSGDGRIDEEYYNLVDDDPLPGDGLADEDLMPLEGVCEVAYVMGLGGASAPNTLYRAVLSPIGQRPTGNDSAGDSGADHYGMTFFNDVGADDALGNSYRIGKKALPLADGVIYFEVLLWTQYTTTWDTAVPFHAWANSYSPEDCGPTFTWDSDRLEDPDTPEFEMDWAGLESEVQDNVFPRAIKVVVTVEPPRRLQPASPLRLRTPLNVGDTRVDVIGESPPRNPQWPYIRVGQEWIRYSDYVTDPAGDYFLVAPGGRGQRGTEEADHAAGERVAVGYTFSRVFYNPAAREAWGQ